MYIVFSSKLTADQKKVFTFNPVDPGLLKFDPQTTLNLLQSMPENVTGEYRLRKAFELNLINNNYN